MREKQENEIADNALVLFRFVKRLLRGDVADPVLTPFRNQSYQVLRVLERHGPLPMSEIGRRLFIAKQNMTTLADKLMQDGLAERKGDADDRRITNIVITEKGRRSLKTTMSAVKSIIKSNLTSLSDDDIEALRVAIRTIKTISSKFEAGDDHARD